MAQVYKNNILRKEKIKLEFFIVIVCPHYDFAVGHFDLDVYVRFLLRPCKLFLSYEALFHTRLINVLHGPDRVTFNGC